MSDIYPVQTVGPPHPPSPPGQRWERVKRGAVLREISCVDSRENCPWTFPGQPCRFGSRNLCGTETPPHTFIAGPNSQVIVMILKISASLAFAAACLTAVVAMPANANTPSARQNVIHSDHYTRMLETNRAFRQARMRKECGPVTDPELHQQCLASFQEYSPMVASAASHQKVASSRHHAKQYVGSSAGPRHYQSHLGK